MLPPTSKADRIGQRRQKLPVVALDIAHHVLQALHQAHAFRLHRAFQRVGIGREVVGRRKQVDDLAGEELHPRLVGLIEPFDIRDRILDRLGAKKVLVLDEVEIGMRLPQRVGEALVALQLGIVGGATNCP
jgi:hypothetical protein